MAVCAVLHTAGNPCKSGYSASEPGFRKIALAWRSTLTVGDPTKRRLGLLSGSSLPAGRSRIVVSRTGAYRLPGLRIST